MWILSMEFELLVDVDMVSMEFSFKFRGCGYCEVFL